MNRKIKILVADDHFLIRDGLIRLIHSIPLFDAEIFEAVDGTEVIHLATTIEFDIILLDLRMPKIDGLKALQILRDEHVMAPVLIISFYDNLTIFKRAINAGAQGYICKDALAEEIENALLKVLNGEQFLQPHLAAELAKDQAAAERRMGLQSELTKRELEILRLIVGEKSAKEIATILNISARTVEWHKENLREKLGVHSDVGLTKIALHYGIS